MDLHRVKPIEILQMVQDPCRGTTGESRKPSHWRLQAELPHEPLESVRQPIPDTVDCVETLDLRVVLVEGEKLHAPSSSPAS